jgi:hypothetical protein
VLGINVSPQAVTERSVWAIVTLKLNWGEFPAHRWQISQLTGGRFPILSSFWLETAV